MQSLLDVHRAIQKEFELDDDHLWAFYLSGDYGDVTSEFGPAARARSPQAKLAELSLEARMRVGYVFDFGDNLRHDLEVEAVDDAADPALRSAVLERVGTPPAQYPSSEEGDGTAPTTSGGEEFEQAVPFAPEVLDALTEGQTLVEAAEYGPLRGAARERALKLVGVLLDALPDGERLVDLLITSDLEADLLISDLLSGAREGGDTPEVAALEQRFARIPQPDEHDHGFAPELVEKVNLAKLRFEKYGETPEERLAWLSEAVRVPIVLAIYEVCREPGRLGELACRLQWPELEVYLLDDLTLRAAKLEEHELQALISDATRALGPTKPHQAAVTALAAAGQQARALRLLEGVEAGRATLTPQQLLFLGRAYLALRHFDRAANVLSPLLERRWLSGKIRPEVVTTLRKALQSAGRAEEVRALEQRETPRLKQDDALRTGTVIREGVKVSRNDPCPCGSGKKAKKCCGVT